MWRPVSNVFFLSVKEIRSLMGDWFMLGLVIFSFTISIVSMAQNTAQEVQNATIAIADEDQSQLSRAIAQDFLPPYFMPAVQISVDDIGSLLDRARYTFIVDIPPHFQNDVQAGRQPTVQVDIDATAAMQAGIGSDYVQQIIQGAVQRSVSRTDTVTPNAVTLTVHLAFNPNATSGWFMAIMGIVNNITMLAMLLCGAAVIREREHGTMDHLLTLPLSPVEIASAKVLANGFVILIAAALSLYLIVRGLLAVPIAGSIPLFLCGVALYLFYALAVGLFLATLVQSMPQFGLLFIIVYLPMLMLSGGNTPLESEPLVLQYAMQGVASTHFVSFAQAILFRGAGFALVWRDYLIVAALGALFFVFAVLRFRRSTAMSQG